MGDYFLDAPVARGRDGRRRSSAADITANEIRSGFNPFQIWSDIINPNENEMVEPFSFVSTKTSWQSGFKLALGLVGQLGYTFGAILLCSSLVQIPSKAPQLAPGVGAPPVQGPDGTHLYKTPPAAIGAVVFGLGIMCGLASSLLFLKDGLRIAGNRRKAFTYVTLHILGMGLISANKFIVAYGKNHIPIDSVIALSLPGGIGRGLLFCSVPRAFSNAEIVHGDLGPFSFESRQLASEALRICAAVFFTLWAASWAISDFEPLEREGWGILASLSLNLSVALPNTNLRRADIYRRSQTSLLSPQLQSFQLRSPTPRVQSPPARQPSSIRSPRIAEE